MKKAIVIYSSKRGSTRQYAEWIAEDLSKQCECKLVPFTESRNINLYEYDLIVYGGWIRGSGIVDFDNFRKQLDGELLEKLILFGVGIADETPENYMQVWSLNLGKIDPRNEHKAVLYILGGKYNPELVSGFDGMLMKVCKKVLTSGKTKDGEAQADMMLDRINNGCNLMKRNNINSLIKDCIKRL